jgi:3-oxoacyl-[acyl-carrier protein] reductase
VNAVAPGVVQTDMTGHLDTKQVMPLIPLRRLGTPEDVASVIGFLCTDPDMYIHGQVIGIDGGLSM